MNNEVSFHVESLWKSEKRDLKLVESRTNWKVNHKNF